MKKLFLVFTVFLFIAACAPEPMPPTATQPAVINLPLVNSPQLTQFHFLDQNDGWGALTPDQDFSASLASFQFVSPLIGWARTTNEASDPSLYKTTDGGATWTLIIP